MSTQAPGLFRVLHERGVVNDDSLAPLLELLVDEGYVRSSARDGEAFDSSRWPLELDAALAGWIAARWDDPAVARALGELTVADGDAARLRALTRRADARVFASAGADAAMFRRLWPDAGPAELAVFGEPREDGASAQRVADLCHAYAGAADGLYAYHVHRGLPGPGAEAAARVAEAAIGAGRITAEGLIAAAIEALMLVRLTGALTRACAAVVAASGVNACRVIAAGFIAPAGGDRIDFLLAAGPRALIGLQFDELPGWTRRIREFRGRPLITAAGAEGFELRLGEVERAEDRAPAAVAALGFFVELVVDTHLARCPGHAAKFPVLDDAALDRLF